MLSDFAARGSARILTRCLASSAITSNADVPAVIKQTVKEPTLFQWLGWSYPERTKTPMDQPFVPVAAITPYEYPAAKPQAQMTTLDNGLRIISVKSPVSSGKL